MYEKLVVGRYLDLPKMDKSLGMDVVGGPAHFVSTPGRDYQIFDTDVRGFSITIYPSGNRAFTLDYRVGGRQRRMTIGRWPEWTTVAARERATGRMIERSPAMTPEQWRAASRSAASSLRCSASRRSNIAQPSIVTSRSRRSSM